MAATSKHSPTPTATPRKVTVSGNKTFDKQAVVQISGIKSDPKQTPQEVKDHLQSTGYFEDIRVTQDADSMNIYIKEKINWFVIQ